jgi:hypothetical protein
MITPGLGREELNHEPFLSDDHIAHELDLNNRKVERVSPPKTSCPSTSGQIVVVELYEGIWTIPAG